MPLTLSPKPADLSDERQGAKAAVFTMIAGSLAMESAKTLARVRSSIDWTDWMLACWGPMGGLTACFRSLQRDLSEAHAGPDAATRQVRLELTQGAINAARSYLDELELATAQALEEARR